MCAPHALCGCACEVNVPAVGVGLHSTHAVHTCVAHVCLALHVEAVVRQQSRLQQWREQLVRVGVACEHAHGQHRAVQHRVVHRGLDGAVHRPAARRGTSHPHLRVHFWREELRHQRLPLHGGVVLGGVCQQQRRRVRRAEATCRPAPAAATAPAGTATEAAPAQATRVAAVGGCTGPAVRSIRGGGIDDILLARTSLRVDRLLAAGRAAPHASYRVVLRCGETEPAPTVGLGLRELDVLPPRAVARLRVALVPQVPRNHEVDSGRARRRPGRLAATLARLRHSTWSSVSHGS